MVPAKQPRRAYRRAVGEFLEWCTDAGVPSVPHVAPLHVATWIEAQTRELSAPSVKQWLAALRHLFDSCRPTRQLRCAARSTSSKAARRRCSIRPRRGPCSTASTPRRRRGRTNRPSGRSAPGRASGIGSFRRLSLPVCKIMGDNGATAGAVSPAPRAPGGPRHALYYTMAGEAEPPQAARQRHRVIPD
jgi:hypothetical protein